MVTPDKKSKVAVHLYHPPPTLLIFADIAETNASYEPLDKLKVGPVSVVFAAVSIDNLNAENSAALANMVMVFTPVIETDW